VVVSPISHRSWLAEPNEDYRRYLTELGRACSAWLRSGRRVRFVCSQISMDPPVAEKMIDAIDPSLRVNVEFARVSNVNEFLAAVVDACAVVTSRLHGAILSLAAGTPVIAISPARKVTRLMFDLKVSSYCVPVGSFTSTDLEQRLEQVSSNPQLRNEISERVGALRDQLEHAYDDLAALLLCRRRSLSVST
jgi:polysaccharide pyruvyl transferase WcaK-like protein